jgi:hypothetical protein
MKSAYGHDLPELGSRARDPGRVPQADARWLLFAGTVLGLIGTVNVIIGVSAASGQKVNVPRAHYAFGDLELWGWVLIVVGLLALAASFAIFTGSRWARAFGIAVGVVNALTQLLSLAAHPLWAVMAFAIDLLLIHALVVHGGRPIN